MAEAPALVGGCYIKGEEGPACWGEGPDEVCCVGGCGEAVAEAADEEEAVGFGGGRGCVFEGDEGFGLVLACVSLRGFLLEVKLMRKD